MNEPIIVTVTRDYNPQNHFITLDRLLPEDITLYTNDDYAVHIKKPISTSPIYIEYIVKCSVALPAGTQLEWRVESKEVQSDLRDWNPILSESDFNKYLKERLAEIVQTLQIKGKEYIRNSDRFHNFNTGSKLKQKPREIILDDYMFKHYVSYRDMLSDIEKGTYPTEKYIREKLGDLIVYFILQEIGLKQKLNGNSNKTD